MSNYVIETDQGYVKLSDKNDVELYMWKTTKPSLDFFSSLRILIMI